MAKRVITATTTESKTNKFSLDKLTRYVGCDDGSTYVFTFRQSAKKWELKQRLKADGSVSNYRGQLPRTVVAHMDGFTFMNNADWEK